jgi:endonuclease G
MSETRVRIPIEITIRVGEPRHGGDTLGAPADVPAQPPQEAIPVDDDYSNRKGYATDFLRGGPSVPLPTLTDAGMALVSRDSENNEPVLRYHHFSLMVNRKRRLLFFAAWNLERKPGEKKKSRADLQGGAKDQWILDPRIPSGHQVTTRELYGPTVFDRGHIVRREDAYWGPPGEAEYANFDTFHYTNCTPQHPAYNQSSKKGLWGLLENHVTKEATDNEIRLCIFGGPVLAGNDPVIENVKIPRRFWKVIVAKTKKAKLGAWAFLLSQAKLVDAEKDASEGTFAPGEFDTYQIALARIQDLTEVRFDRTLLDADTFKKAKTEGPTASTRIDAPSDIQMPEE